MARINIWIRVIVLFTLFLLLFNQLSVKNYCHNNSKMQSDSSSSDNLDSIFDLEPDFAAFPPRETTRMARYLEDKIELDDETVQLIVISGDAYDNAYNVGAGSPLATGDIDNDGFEDLLIGSPYADGKPENIGSAGQVMVIFGRNQTSPGTLFDQAAENTNEINLVIHGGDGADLLGLSIACGDIDGDGFDDMVLAAPYGDGKNDGRVNSGEIYVIYGDTRTKLGTEINLQSTTANLMIYGTSGGAWPNYDLCGYSVAVGDVLGDSKDDIIIGAPYANPSGRTNAGSTYVIMGDTKSKLGTELDLRVNTDVRIIGAQPRNSAGVRVAAGDINNDGRGDIIIGAPFTNPYGTRANAGTTYVIYGQQSLTPTIDLNDSADVNIHGAGIDDYLGYSLGIGNINGDQYKDIIVCSPYADGPSNGLWACGEVYIIYGSATLASTIDINANGQDVIIIGENVGDVLGYAIATGNVNNDQYDDILLGAFLGDGDQDLKTDCGEAYLILGNSTANLGNNIDASNNAKSIFYGIDDNDYAGRHIQMGDLDGDLNDDIIISAPLADGENNGRDSAGEFYLIYGAPPPTKNEFLMLMDGDVDNKTVLARYRNYTFKVNVSNTLGYKDFKSVTLTFDPSGYNISYRWYRNTNGFIRFQDPLRMVECVSTNADVKHDGWFNYSIDFRLIFDWSFFKSSSIDCKVTSVGFKSHLKEDLYPKLCKVNNQLNFKGDLEVEGAIQGKLSNNDWVKGGEELTFKGLTVVYDGTSKYFPHVNEYSLGVQDITGKTKIESTDPGTEITATIRAPEVTMDIDYQLLFLDIPSISDNSSQIITLKIDNDPPEPPVNLICKADSFTDDNPAEVDNDIEVYLQWDAALDEDSGTNKYYYNFEYSNMTNSSLWTSNLETALNNATEGLNTIYVWAEDTVGNIGQPITTQIFIDLTQITFENFAPQSDDWFTSKNITCTIEAYDRNGFGVNPEAIEYWDIKTKTWTPVYVANDNNDTTFIEIEITAELNEGKDSFLKFRGFDLAGNGPAESDTYYFKIDSTPVKFTNVNPDPQVKQTSQNVRCSIIVQDLGGSGVNMPTLQYSYTTNGLDNFTEWSDTDIGMIGKPINQEESSTWFVDLTFKRGSANFIRWRAMDLAGNDYTVSENYSVRVNALPTIIVKKIGQTEIYSDTFINLNAENTYDADDDNEVLEFYWNSNISGSLGNYRNITTKLPAGHHQISLLVFDGLNSATYQLNLTVAPSKKAKSKDGGVLSISEDSDPIVILLIIIIILIIVLFLALLSREIRKRKQLEDKVMHLGIPTSSQYQPMVPKTLQAPGLIREGVPTQEPFSVSGSPYGMTPKEPSEQLPRVGETGIHMQTMGGAPVPEPSSSAPDIVVGTPGQPLPQLPPALEHTQDQAQISQPYDQLQPNMGAIPPTQEPAYEESEPSITSEPQLGLTPNSPEFQKRLKNQKGK